MAGTREQIPEQLVQDVLLKSKRRCCLCFAEGITGPRRGSITHIDSDPRNNEEDNLVFLCLSHHDLLESKRRRPGPGEIRLLRSRLYDAVTEGSLSAQRGGMVVSARKASQIKETPQGQKFEEEVLGLLRTRLEASLGKDVSVFFRKRYVGRSGANHEVDISAKLAIAGFSVFLIVEVKHAKRKLGPNDIMAFVAKVNDLGANKGLVVTNSGYSSGALAIARGKGIALFEVDERAQVLKEKLIADSL